jgi:hypothetical protein
MKYLVNFIQTWYKYFLHDGSSNIGPNDLQLGDNDKTAKIGRGHLDIFFS